MRTRTTLVCLSYAGGTASRVYERWAAAMPEVEVVPVDYPGRGTRSGETPATSRQELVADLAERVGRHVAGRPWAVFGHSMGARVALRVSRVLSAEDPSAGPRVLFASGSRGPGARPPRGLDAEVTDDELFEQVVGWGGIPPELVDRPSLRPLVVQNLRADLRLAVDVPGQGADDVPLTGDLHVLSGAQDPLVPAGHLAGWHQTTSGRTVVHTFPGDHFFIGEHAQVPIPLVRESLRSLSGGPAPRPLVHLGGGART